MRCYTICLNSQPVCSYLCLNSQLVGNLQLPQLQCQLKPVLWICGHGQCLLFETLNRQRSKPHQHATKLDVPFVINWLTPYQVGYKKHVPMYFLTCFSRKCATLVRCSLGIVGSTLSAIPKSLLITAVWYSNTETSRE